MGVITNIIGRAFGSKRTAYQRALAGPERLSKRIRRDASKARRSENQREKFLEETQKLLKQLHKETDPIKQKTLMAQVTQNVNKMIGAAKEEVQYNARILVSTESILYQIKHNMVDVVAKELRDLFQAGLDVEPSAQPLQKKLNDFEILYQKDLENIMRMMKRESRDRFQFAALALKSAQRIEKEMRNDSRKLRKLLNDFEDVLDDLRNAENQGQIQRIVKDVNQLVDDLEGELRYLVEIAQDDLKVMHKMGKDIDELGQLINQANVDQSAKQAWLNQWQQLKAFEQQAIDNMRKQTLTEYRREA